MSYFEDKVHNLIYDSSKHLTTLCTGSILIMVAINEALMEISGKYSLYCFLSSFFCSTLVIILLTFTLNTEISNFFDGFIAIIWLISYAIFFIGIILIVLFLI